MENTSKHAKSSNNDRSVLIENFHEQQMRQNARKTVAAAAGNNTTTRGTTRSSGSSKRSVNDYKIEVVKPRDYKKAAKTLKIAFSADPFINYLTKDTESKRSKDKLLDALFEYSVHSCLAKGLVVAIRDKDAELLDRDAPFLGVSCWVDPESREFFWDFFTSGHFKVLRIANKQSYKKIFTEQYPLLDKVRAGILKGLSDSTWYLNDIGILPSARGKGLAKKMIQHVFKEYIDPFNYYVYLESSNPVNLKIYEKIGFTFVKTFRVGDEENEKEVLTMDAMIRYPNLLQNS